MARIYSAEILSAKTIHKKGCTMDGWPTIVRKNDGELIVFFSGDRKFHACPYGKSMLVRSRDDGRTWAEAELINNTPLDDRDTGGVQTASGALVMTWFTSVAFESEEIMYWVFADLEQRRREMAAWKPISDALTDEVRLEWLGSWARRSPSGDGRVWEAPVRLPVSAPHGPIALKDGRLLMLGKEIFDNEATELSRRLRQDQEPGSGRIMAVESRDDGRTWRVISVIDTAAAPMSCEPHLVECADGTLVAMTRSDEPGPDYPPCVSQTESHDGGHTWTPLHRTFIGGLPPHLLRLSDGRLLLTLGRRYGVMGQYAAVSEDNGTRWSEAFPVAPAAPAADHGYPCTVEMPDGSFLTAYYEPETAEGKPVVKLSHWKLKQKIMSKIVG